MSTQIDYYTHLKTIKEMIIEIVMIRVIKATSDPATVAIWVESNELIPEKEVLIIMW